MNVVGIGKFFLICPCHVNIVTTVTISEAEDRYTDEFKLSSLCREKINCLSLSHLGKP